MVARHEPSIGLEVHAELSTRTKVFCGCSTAAGASPNTQVCAVCLGFPGVLPALNRNVVEYALRAALAMHCAISRPSIFERKGYYYPDLPKNFQISQKRAPLGKDGYLEIVANGEAKRVRIADVHIEEDAAKLLHPEDDPQHSLVDFNRSGIPLLEIVSEPDMSSVAEVEAYMSAVRSMLRYLGISEARMEQGQLRFEASVSVRPQGAAELGTRVEIKNLNSFRAVAGAVDYEISRQTRALEQGEPIIQETRLWDDARGVTEPMRTKETAMDYRYFPEPDLTPLEIDDEWIARVQAGLPELAEVRRRRLTTQYGLSDYDAGILTSEKGLADLFEGTVAASEASGYRRGQAAGGHPDCVTIRSGAMEQLVEPGHTVGEIRKSHRDILGIDPDANATIGGQYVDDARKTQGGEVLEFISTAGRKAAHWITGRLLYLWKQGRVYSLEEMALNPEMLAALLQSIESGDISRPAARQEFDRLATTRDVHVQDTISLGIEESAAVVKSARELVRGLGQSQISDQGQLAAMVDEVIAENPDAVENFRKGKEAALKFLVGQVMRKSKGRANPQMATELLRAQLAGQ
jgi:aspartyl-tRNA(Asn)/glutamyl-tRNA(Gln) amidotransferase subunit B